MRSFIVINRNWVTPQKINYTYSADRTKLQKVTNDNGNVTTTDYAGNFVYENNVLKQFNQPEGYVEPDGSGWQYVYRYVDIWGNTRITYADDNNDGSVNSSEIRREQNYYPFGLKHKGYNNNPLTNHPYKYNGKELNEELGLDWYDFGARNYDAALGRWFGIDVLAEDYYSSSPYAFVGNNPMTNLEIDGRFWIRTVDEGGTVTYEAEEGDSANSLYQQFGEQDGLTAEMANDLVEGTLGSNYIRESDGMLMSDVEVGDTVNVYTEQETTEPEISVSEITPEGIETNTTETQVPDFGFIGDLTGANALMQDMDIALDIYEAEGIMSYLYYNIGMAHREESGGMFTGRSRARGRGSRGQRGTTNRRGTTSAKPASVPRTVTVSGQKKTVQTGPRGGKYYINKNGNKTYLNKDGTKRN